MLTNARQKTLVSNMPCTWPISYYFYLFLSLFTYYYFFKKDIKSSKSSQSKPTMPHNIDKNSCMLLDEG